ncbi:translation factor GTPase family protein [Lachnospiraceae bacterium 29-84]
MDDTSGNTSMEHICAGILAHVDAGKTTLSEALLYVCGNIREMGRVDKKNAFLDTYELERARGITIFSKQAVLKDKDRSITLLDTPGHVDFSAEMERTLQVLDYAILVISGVDGVQGHTRTLWYLLEKYQIPVFLFINKMDLHAASRESLLGQLASSLDGGCVDFTGLDGETEQEAFYESIAMCEEETLEYFLAHGRVEDSQIRRLIAERKVFPCFFGSALKCEGVEEFFEGFGRFARQPGCQEAFGAKVFKIARDSQGNRLTYLKVTGGSLKVKTPLTQNQEKINQIRIYSGEKYETVPEAMPGMVCAVTGLVSARPGDGLGCEPDSARPFLIPVLTYQVIVPPDCDNTVMLSYLYQIQEEEPELHIAWKEQLQEIQVQVMGEVQLEILKSMIADRFGVEVSFGAGNVLYKETIVGPVEGVGHYEPLRHYAEVHLLLEPGEPGSGLVFDTVCSEDILDRNWQRLVLTHLEEKEHCGVLTGSALTDVKVTLVTGRAHLKHTEGGDFRQATYRALRQGLMEAESVLLEPIYQFRLETPDTALGRAIADIEQMRGSFDPPQLQDGMAVLTGSVPVAAMGDYQKEVAAYTRGNGRMSLSLKGYEPCKDPQEVMERIGYDPERDLENPASSVFCSHGAGFVVKWDQVKEYMHVESPDFLSERKAKAGLYSYQDEEVKRLATQNAIQRQQSVSGEEGWIGEDEVEAILSKSLDANKHEKAATRKGYHKRKGKPAAPSSSVTKTYQVTEPKEAYWLVDGYNVIFAWKELRELAEENIDGARGRLLDILCDYQGMIKCQIIVVFDAYRVQRHKAELLDYHNIHVVFTKEAETADQYIEKFAHTHAKKYQITVVTSDGLEQIIIRGQGCALVSARELEQTIQASRDALYQEYGKDPEKGKVYLGDFLS